MEQWWGFIIYDSSKTSFIRSQMVWIKYVLYMFWGDVDTNIVEIQLLYVPRYPFALY